MVSDAQQEGCSNIGRGNLNIVLSNNISMGETENNDLHTFSNNTISAETNSIDKSPMVISDNCCSSSSSSINQQKGEVIGAGHQFRRPNRGYIRSTVNKSNILDFSTQQNRTEEQSFPEEGQQQGPHKGHQLDV